MVVLDVADQKSEKLGTSIPWRSGHANDVGKLLSATSPYATKFKKDDPYDQVGKMISFKSTDIFRHQIDCRH